MPIKTIPKVIQLPGGIKLSGVMFRIVAYNDDGSPKTFELLPKGSQPTGNGLWTLYANEEEIRTPVPEHKR